MSKGKTRPLRVTAMHGWAGDSRCWRPWVMATQRLGWLWQTGERGYGELEPQEPAWPEAAAQAEARLVIGHSLGPHLVPPHVLAQADIVVLLASFAVFAPPGREGRRARAALAGMASSLRDEPQARRMLTDFMDEAAEPQSSKLMPPGPLDGALNEINRARLQADLDLLGRCKALPAGFPPGARVLIVEAEEDRIVDPVARRILRETLPHAAVLRLVHCGHALLGADIVDRVVDWVEGRK